MFGSHLMSLDVQTLCRAVGLLGFAIYVMAFFALSIGKLDSTRPLYFALVFVASSCVMVSLWADFNLSAALIQAFYITISLCAILMRLRRWRMEALVRT